MIKIIENLQNQVSELSFRKNEERTTALSSIQKEISRFLNLEDINARVSIYARKEGCLELGEFYRTDFSFFTGDSNFECIACELNFTGELEINGCSFRLGNNNTDRLMLMSKVIDWFNSGITSYIEKVQTIAAAIDSKYDADIEELRLQIQQLEEVMEEKAKKDKLDYLDSAIGKKIELLPRFEYDYDKDNNPIIVSNQSSIRFYYTKTQRQYIAAYQIVSASKTKKFYTVKTWNRDYREDVFERVSAELILNLIDTAEQWNATGSEESRARAQEFVKMYKK